MTKFLSIIISFLSVILFSQNSSNLLSEIDTVSIHEKTFNHVIKVLPKDIKFIDGKYFIDIPQPNNFKTPVFYFEEKISMNIIENFMPEFSKIIVITPNWDYYSSIDNFVSNSPIICAEPMRSNIIYKLNRVNAKVLKDSIIVNGNVPNLNFIN